MQPTPCSPPCGHQVRRVGTGPAHCRPQSGKGVQGGGLCRPHAVETGNLGQDTGNDSAGFLKKLHLIRLNSSVVIFTGAAICVHVLSRCSCCATDRGAAPPFQVLEQSRKNLQGFLRQLEARMLVEPGPACGAAVTTPDKLPSGPRRPLPLHEQRRPKTVQSH